MPRRRIPRPSASSSSSTATSSVPPPTSLLYRQDIVERHVDGKIETGIVLRTWHEEADHIAETGASLPHQHHHHHGDLDRPLRKGEVGVVWRTTGEGDRAIVASSEVKLVDRLLVIGDIVKKSLTQAQSGVIVDTESMVQLKPKPNLERPPEVEVNESRLLEVPARELISTRRYSPGSHVVYDDWIGVIEEVIIEHTWASVEKGEDGKHVVYHTYDTISDYDVGKREKRPWTLGDGYIRLTHPCNPPTSDLSTYSDFTLIHVRHRGAWVNWLAVNQTLSPAAQDSHPKPPAYWAEDLPKLILARTSPDGAALVGDMVVFRREEDLRCALVDAYGESEAERQLTLLAEQTEAQGNAGEMVMPRNPGNQTRSPIFEVVSSSLDVTVKWQDGSLSHEAGTRVLPVASMIDPHDTYPGELVTWRSGEAESAQAQTQDQSKGHGHGQLVVVQSFDSEERTAVVAPYAAGSASSEEEGHHHPQQQVVPALELDVYGEEPGLESIWQHGIHRGELVLIGRRPHDSIALPHIPRLGAPVEPGFNWVDSFEQVVQSFLDKHPNKDFSAPFLYPRLSVDLTEEEKGQAKLDWLGMVVDLDSQGYAKILLPDGETMRTVPPTELNKLEDFFNQEDAPLEGAEGMDGEGGMLGMGILGGTVGVPWDQEVRWQTEDGREVEDVEMGEWEDDEEERQQEEEDGDAIRVDEEIGGRRSGANGNAIAKVNGGSAAPPAIPIALDTSTSGPGAALRQFAMEHTITQPDAPPQSQSQPRAAEDPSAPPAHPPSSVAPPSRRQTYTLPSSSRPPSSSPSWSPFEILDSAPSTHHYHSTGPPAGDRTFLSRLTREHKSLRSALPTNIVVRTYSDRLDLLRVLIFGSPGTPYADGPFLFDVALDSFPRLPPKVFFHSWTDGRGRASPNLYEDGKVCLSLLGTWSGERASESWQPSKSSLLQLFVSIASLVLVDQPYYTEPAFERLKGTEEGRVNARLFNEGAYVATMGFVRRAITAPTAVEGFEEVVREYYFGEGSRRLGVLVEDARALLRLSREVRERKKRKRAKEGGGDDVDEGGTAALVEIEGTSMEPLSGGAAIVLERALKGLEALQDGKRSSVDDAAACAPSGAA